MTDHSGKTFTIPDTASIGEDLDWSASWEDVKLDVELPFWLMVPDCTITVTAAGHKYAVMLEEHYSQVHVCCYRDSLGSCIYQGPYPPRKGLLETALAQGLTAMLRKCKTVLRILSRCNSDVIKAASEDNPARKRSAQLYFSSLCAAHIPVVNILLRAYILRTYDPGVHQVAPWDVPQWFVTRQDGEGFITTLMHCAQWDIKPQVSHLKADDNPETGYTSLQFASPQSLTEALLLVPTPGELELAQAMHLRERGDYSGAVRRIATALEVLLESQLRSVLLGRYAEAEVEERLCKSRNDFPGRLRQYLALSRRCMPKELSEALDRIRNLRHEIVHRGRWLTFEERGLSYRAADEGRWIFNWLENSKEHMERRDCLLVKRQLGMHHSVFLACLTPDGVVVEK